MRRTHGRTWGLCAGRAAARRAQTRGLWNIVEGRYDHSQVRGEARAEHIALHDPARVLREVDAKRRRLERHRPEERAVVVQRGRTERRLCCVQCSRPDELLDPDEAAEWPCPDIRDDMAVYADRDGYREEWKL